MFALTGPPNWLHRKGELGSQRPKWSLKWESVQSTMTHIVNYAFPVRRMLCGMGLHVNDPSDQYVKNVSFREKNKTKTKTDLACQKPTWPHWRRHFTPILFCISPLDKMADILADDIFKRIIFNENGIITIQISLKFVLKNPIDNKTECVQVIAWRRTGDKPLPGPMMTQFTHVYMRH